MYGYNGSAHVPIYFQRYTVEETPAAFDDLKELALPGKSVAIYESSTAGSKLGQAHARGISCWIIPRY